MFTVSNITNNANTTTTHKDDERHLWIAGLLAKLLVPSVVTFLATQTPLTACISVWLPLILTLHAVRSSSPSSQDSHQKWLRYWSMQASLEFLTRSCHVVSFFLWTGVKSLLLEIQLVGYLILLYKTLELKFPNTTTTTTTTTNTRRSWIWNLWEIHCLPRMLTCEATISVLSSQAATSSAAAASSSFSSLQAEGETTSIFQRLVLWGNKGVNMLLLLGIVSECRRQWFYSKMQIFTANPALILPSATLLLPSFLTKFGLLYLQWILPAARSMRATTETSKQLQQQEESYWMKYWIVQGILLHGILDYMTFQLPYFMQVAVMWNSWMLLLWIGMLHEPWVVKSAYKWFESELVGFGLLRDGSKNKQGITDASQTRTAQFLKDILKRLPSANAMEDGSLSPKKAIVDRTQPSYSDKAAPQWIDSSSSSSSSTLMDPEVSNENDPPRSPNHEQQQHKMSPNKLFRRTKQSISKFSK